jgi:hypothetical protein
MVVGRLGKREQEDWNKGSRGDCEAGKTEAWGVGRLGRGKGNKG